MTKDKTPEPVLEAADHVATEEGKDAQVEVPVGDVQGASESSNAIETLVDSDEEEALAEAFFEGKEGAAVAVANGSVEEAESVEDDALVPLPHLADEPLWEERQDPVVPPKWQPLLPLAMILLSLIVMSIFVEDIEYFFSPRRAIDLGDISDGCDESFYQKIRHNRFVSVKGVLGQPGMTAEARIRFQKRNYVVAMGCSLLLSMTAEQYKRVALRYFSARGRAMRVNQTGALAPLRKYYGSSGLINFDDKTFIIYVNEHPNHEWWLLIIYLVLGGLLVYNAKAFSLSIWRNWIKGDGSE